MRAIFRRLRRIEGQLTPKANTASQRAAQLLWERRRRHAWPTANPSTYRRRTRARRPRVGTSQLRRRSAVAAN
jgi:aspartate/methionine/tyrosine aminotransferase